MAAEEGWVGIAAVAAHLQVTKDSIYRWVDSNGFPARRVGRLLRFRLSEVDEWVKPGFPFWPWHGHSIHPLRSEQHVLSR